MKTICTLSVLIFCIAYVHPQIINVSTDGLSIQAGIDSASVGDTVLVAEGTYIENIYFRGKAITVASHFILDRDTSHISKTIIDGSQPSVEDSATVVTFCGGEDSTSVLCGFTIMGGKGTLYFHSTLGYKRAGGGIFVHEGSAGKIEYNIIRSNMLDYPIEIWGGGICAMFGSEADNAFNKSLIIQNNTIRNNLVKSSWVQNASSGGGIKIGSGNNLMSGRIIIQNNIISYNEVRNTAAGGGSIGGGMNFGMALPTPPGDYIIRNNEFSYNKVIASGVCRGGGMILIHLNFECEYFFDPRPAPLVYNNIIHHNESNHQGGGIATTQNLMPPCFSNNYQTVHQPAIFNNTIVDNKAPVAAGVYCRFSMAFLFNNILWNDLNAYTGSKEIAVFNQENWPFLITKYNLIQGGWGFWDGNNLRTNPSFKTNSYELSENSPCIGRGLDSVVLTVDKEPGKYDVQYYSTSTDYLSWNRPDAVDRFIDIGAFESPYPKSPMLFEMISSDSVEIGTDIDLTCSEHGMSYLVPVNTEAEPDSILMNQIRSIKLAVNNESVLSTNTVNPGPYWIYAISAYNEISDAINVFVVDTSTVVDTATEIHYIQTAAVQVYPVPVQDFLYVSSVHPVASVELFNAVGRRVLFTRDAESPVNTHHLDQGVYFVRIILHRGGIYTSKVIKK